MTDIHCHILPQVDDGSESMAESLQMARLAAASGVDYLLATPHCNLPYADSGNYKTPALESRFVLLQKAVQDSGIDLHILPGAEVMVSPDTPQLLREGQLLTLAGSDYLLVEFFFDEDPDYMDDMLLTLMAEGVTPVLAHPERYEAVQELPRLSEQWHRSGIVFQLNKSSLLGDLGHRAERTADRLLSRGLADLVASDAHSDSFRTTDMAPVRRYLEKAYGAAVTAVLLDINPERIRQNRTLTPLL